MGTRREESTACSQIPTCYRWKRCYRLLLIAAFLFFVESLSTKATKRKNATRLSSWFALLFELTAKVGYTCIYLHGRFQGRDL